MRVGCSVLRVRGRGVSEFDRGREGWGYLERVRGYWGRGPPSNSPTTDEDILSIRKSP